MLNQIYRHSSFTRRLIVFTRMYLRRWWNRALRRRVLYSALNKEDRGYLFLSMRAFDRIRSVEVGKIIVNILAKLRDALETPFKRRMETFGIERARILSAFALEWGNDKAGGWVQERGFVRYLTMMDVYAI